MTISPLLETTGSHTTIGSLRCKRSRRKTKIIFIGSSKRRHSMSDEILTMKIDGLAELRAKFKDLPDHLQTEVRGILERGAQKFVRNAKRDVTTVDNGTLRNGISYAMLVSDKNHITFQVFSGVYYSPFIEWGTL